jgi:hypothetical protein
MTATKYQSRVLTPADMTEGFRRMDPEMRKQTVSQIARMTLGAISGFRVGGTHLGIDLPVAHGYSVIIHLQANDLYTVRRVRVTRVKGVPVVRLYGEATDVDCERLSEVCYYASCYVSYDGNEWPHKA